MKDFRPSDYDIDPLCRAVVTQQLNTSAVFNPNFEDGVLVSGNQTVQPWCMHKNIGEELSGFYKEDLRTAAAAAIREYCITCPKNPNNN